MTSLDEVLSERQNDEVREDRFVSRFIYGNAAALGICIVALGIVFLIAKLGLIPRAG